MGGVEVAEGFREFVGSDIEAQVAAFEIAGGQGGLVHLGTQGVRNRMAEHSKMEARPGVSTLLNIVERVRVVFIHHAADRLFRSSG